MAWLENVHGFSINTNYEHMKNHQAAFANQRALDIGHFDQRN